jgi:AraC-binding-like domain
MKTAFSTARVHARDRLAYWREEASRIYVAHEFNTRVGRNFNGEISVASLGSVNIAAFECDECLVERTQRCLKGANDDDVLLCRQVLGSISVRQDGRDVATAPGDVYLLDPRRPFALNVGANGRSLVFKVPRWEVQARLGEIASYTAKPGPPLLKSLCPPSGVGYATAAPLSWGVGAQQSVRRGLHTPGLLLSISLVQRDFSFDVWGKCMPLAPA